MKVRYTVDARGRPSLDMAASSMVLAWACATIGGVIQRPCLDCGRLTPKAPAPAVSSANVNDNAHDQNDQHSALATQSNANAELMSLRNGGRCTAIGVRTMAVTRMQAPISLPITSFLLVQAATRAEH
jgi:hypothetical protein